jgi:hypothetical protein
MKTVLKIIALTISSFIGSVLFIIIGFDLIIIDEEEISIWVLLLTGLIGAIVFWLITDFLLRKIFQNKY